jgi:hypothetical protein
LEHPTLAATLQAGRVPEDTMLSQLGKDDVPGLFWLANAWAAAINVGKEQVTLVAQLPIAKKIAERCLTLDETYFDGGPHVLVGMLEAALPKALGGRPDLAREHFEKALTLSGYHNLMNRVLFARYVAPQENNRQFFVASMNDVLAADPAVKKNDVLVNQLAQKRARRYLNMINDLFLE